MTLRKTKIVCTLGPSTEKDEVLRELILSGMNVARLNFSHGSHEYHLQNIQRVRRMSLELNKPIAIMLDTKGPEYRIGTFENGKIWDDKMVIDVRDNTDTEIMYKEINNRTIRYQLFIEKRLKRYLKESLIGVFSKYINKQYSFGNKGTIEDDVEEYVEKNLLKLYKVDKIYMYVKEERMRINDKNIENEYLKYVGESNEIKIENGFPVEIIGDGVVLKNGKFSMGKINEFDRMITYNLKNGFKESFGFGVSFKRK
jgi:hypothetical protein